MKIGKRFYYRPSDRKVAVILLLFAIVSIAIILLVGNLPSETQGYEGDKDSSHGQRMQVGEELSGTMTKESSDGYYYAGEAPKPELFPFDPNTADSTALLRLGLKPWQVRNIYKYRARGGIYRRPSDFAKLFGLTVKQYRELEPYIKISADYQPASSLVKEEQYSMRDTLRYPLKLKEGEFVVLNVADTTALKRVPGIGSFFARAIVRYGERLGGYVSVSQLDEIEGFPTDAKRYFKLEDSQPRRLNVNKLTLAQLRKHPYIGYFRARTITEYRRLHGRIESLEDLNLDKDFTPEAIGRLKPYIEY